MSKVEIPLLDPEWSVGAFRDLLVAGQRLNEAVRDFRNSTGLWVSLSVNGHEYGDRIGIRIEGYLIDAYAKDPTHD